MTRLASNMVWHPRLAEGCDRITARQREANIAAEGQPVNVYTDPRVADEMARYENYRTAKAVLQSPNWYGADVIHAARDFIHEYENAIPAKPPARDNGKRFAAVTAGYLAAMAVMVILAGLGWVTP
jgi:hypothetical protein